MREKIKTVLAFTLLIVVVAISFVLTIRDRDNDVYPDADTMIRLYGEAHGSKVYYDIEYQLWKDCYEEGDRNLFVELPYYSAEFLNLWMREAGDETLDQLYSDIQGTQSATQDYLDFLHEIKENCPETVFWGTDVGHQNETTGERYLKYLKDLGLEDSEAYQKTQECMRQGDEYNAADTDHTGISPVREKYMTENFIKAYDAAGGKIMGIYGSYHTDLSIPDRMAGMLRTHYGDIFSSVKLSTIAFGKVSPYQIGVSVTGILFLIMLFVPNILWAHGRQPEGYEQYAKNENRILLVFERVGEVSATCLLPIFASTNPHIKKLPEGVFFEWKSILLLTAFVLMLFYEGFWIRYFRSSKTMKDYYASFAGFPVAGASLPVIALFLLGLYAQNLLLMASSVILGTGHLGIHLAHKKEALINDPERPDDVNRQA